MSERMLVSDGGQHCSLHHIGVVSDGDYTEVYVMQKEQFPDWFLKNIELLRRGV